MRVSREKKLEAALDALLRNTGAPEDYSPRGLYRLTVTGAAIRNGLLALQQKSEN